MRPGELVEVAATTSKDVGCLLTMQYQFTDPVELDRKVTNSKGRVTWAWVVDPGGPSDAVYVTVDCGQGDLWGIAQVDIPIEPWAITCGVAAVSGRVAVDGVLSPGEWAEASVFGPVAAQIGSNLIMARIYVRPDPRNLSIAVQFDRDLSSLAVHTVAVRLDATPIDGSWNAGGSGNGDDGFVANLVHGWFIDEHFSTAVDPNQGQRDDEYGGTNDGSMAVGYHDTTTIVEISHPISGGDPRDAALAPGGEFGLSVSTYMENSDGQDSSTNLVPWHRSGPMQWAACEIPAD